MKLVFPLLISVVAADMMLGPRFLQQEPDYSACVPLAQQVVLCIVDTLNETYADSQCLKCQDEYDSLTGPFSCGEFKEMTCKLLEDECECGACVDQVEAYTVCLNDATPEIAAAGCDLTCSAGFHGGLHVALALITATVLAGSI